jgi:hypothetical protein
MKNNEEVQKFCSFINDKLQWTQSGRVEDI